MLGAWRNIRHSFPIISCLQYIQGYACYDTFLLGCYLHLASQAVVGSLFRIQILHYYIKWWNHSLSFKGGLIFFWKSGQSILVSRIYCILLTNSCQNILAHLYLRYFICICFILFRDQDYSSGALINILWLLLPFLHVKCNLVLKALLSLQLLVGRAEFLQENASMFSLTGNIFVLLNFFSSLIIVVKLVKFFTCRSAPSNLFFDLFMAKTWIRLLAYFTWWGCGTIWE